jgi:CheY-like chemotaxis protein
MFDQLSWNHGVQLVDSLAWPLFVLLMLLVVLWKFGRQLAAWLENATDMSFKAGGVEVNLRRDLIKAGAGAAAAVHQKTNRDSPDDLSELASLLEPATTSVGRKQLQKSKILWVDDQPGNNLHEFRTLRSLGISIDAASDTEEAWEKIQRAHYDLVISDMARQSSDRAGYDLLSRLRQTGSSVPFVIYSGTNLPEHRLEAIKSGAQGSTSDPRELFEFVLSNLLK